MKRDLRAGDWVVVKSPSEIAATLSAEGTLDNLPFLPEMLEYCGKRFRVLRRAEKTCIETPGMRYKFGEFRNNDVVILEGLRCSGSAHDGCGRWCTLFWKTQWLRKAKKDEPVSSVDGLDCRELASKLKTKSGPERYFCQSTELAKATTSMTRFRILMKCMYDVLSGSRGILEIVRLVVRALWNKATYDRPRPKLAGTLMRTPSGSLNLRPGDLVKIKSADEIAKTLDKNGRNRGLSCDYGMCAFRGPVYRVANRLDFMISESTGEMKKVPGTVMLEGLYCTCAYVVGGCPRQEPQYWRELWLEKVER